MTVSHSPAPRQNRAIPIMSKKNIIFLNTKMEGSRCQMHIDDQRASERFNCEAPVIIENCDTGAYYDGSMYNYSRGGMYVELDHRLVPGSEIRILIEESNSSSRSDSCLAQVIWCEEIPGAVVLYNYGIGVQYDLTVKPAKIIEKFHVIEGGACKNSSG